MQYYNFEGKSYEIIITDEWDRNEQREEQILRDFKYLESKYDWGLIKLRITNGLWEGWLKEIDYVIGDNGTHYKDKWERGKEEGFNKEVDEEGFW